MLTGLASDDLEKRYQRACRFSLGTDESANDTSSVFVTPNTVHLSYTSTSISVGPCHTLDSRHTWWTAKQVEQ